MFKNMSYLSTFMDKNVLKRLYFFLLFVILVYFANKVNFSALVGTDNQFFTLFQFFGD